MSITQSIPASQATLRSSAPHSAGRSDRAGFDQAFQESLGKGSVEKDRSAPPSASSSSPTKGADSSKDAARTTPARGPKTKPGIRKAADKEAASPDEVPAPDPGEAQPATAAAEEVPQSEPGSEDGPLAEDATGPECKNDVPRDEPPPSALLGLVIPQPTAPPEDNLQPLQSAEEAAAAPAIDPVAATSPAADAPELPEAATPPTKPTAAREILPKTAQRASLEVNDTEPLTLATPRVTDPATQPKDPAAVPAEAIAPAAAPAEQAGTPGSDQPKPPEVSPADRLSAILSLASGSSTPATQESQITAAPAPVPATPEDRFAVANTPTIVSSVGAKLLDNGGTITLRLDPPELGALQVAVKMKDGLASISFQAGNAEAAKLLTQSLGKLHESLSAAGLTIDRVTVQHTPESNSSSSSGNDSRGSSSDGRNASNPFQGQDEAARREQQRRELLERMWRRTAGDELSYVA